MAVLALLAPGAESAAASVDQATKDYLEGVWMVGKTPSTPNCLDTSERAKLVEFEFRRTGGRYMEIETPIIFVTSPIAAIERNGDDVTITTPPWTRTFHIVSVDRLSNKAYTLTRCGLPNRQVNVGVPLEQLRVLTPTGTNDVEFLEARAGVTDEQSCKNSLGGFKHWLTFDVFGPVHFYVQGEVGD